MSDKKFREAKLKRTTMSAGARERLKIEDTLPVWTATCPICKQHLRGTIPELQAHKHG